ncbi:CD209 antigen-like protein E [Oryzias melastigma]|uniref:CD209 antigen-like protein E n=1 Tax=Oryzias melastigma TaxID=30732 RepID=UPI000CF7C653|nr:CD209 antigen-like protein E [Oryzias melastigma]
MSTETEDLRVKFNRNLHHDGREQSEVEILEDEDQISDHGLQQTEKQKLKNLQVKRRNCFRVLKLFLGVFYFLILAGLMTRHLLLSLENNKTKNSYNQLQTELSVINKTLLDESNQLKTEIEGKRCPKTWIRFGCSCYFKSTEERTWYESRSFCQDKGSYLLVINSREEQEFVSKLNPNKESWIGLNALWSSQKNKSEWKWVDGSPLTETFWDETFPKDPNNYNAVFLSTEGKWKEQFHATYKNWICEK